MKELTSIEQLVYRMEFKFWLKNGMNEVQAHHKGVEKVKKLAKLREQVKDEEDGH